MNMPQTCDPNRLDAFVRGELSEQQESELTAHLDQCETCGEELERRVAAADQWREAGELLTHRTRRFNVMDGANDPSTGGSFATSTTFAEQMDQVVGMLAPTDDPQMLGRIGGYEVSGVIGCGGMGVVFKAHDRSLDRVVAIKVMAPHLAGSGAARKRFARESKAAAAVLHPNVIAIHCVADDPKLPYLVMPYIGGASLQKRVEADGPLCTQDTLRIGQQIAAGLAAAHAQGLVHRDIKPANILLERGVERVTITDFGLARAVDDATMTRSGVIAGTPQYMSPEQACGESIDHRSDLFSLGSVLYMMCAGHSPFRAETTFGILRRITDNQPRPLREINPDVPEWLCAIIEKLHAKEPSERFQSAEEVAELLEGCLAHVQQPTAIPLPASVEQLSQLLPVASTAPQQAKKQSRQLFYTLPPIGKFIAAATGAFALFFAGILIVLEWNKGTLTIESELDDVPIRIMKGGEVVKSLTVSKEGAMTRIGAGKYIVEIGQEFDKAVIKVGGVELLRGATAIVKVTQTNTNTAADEKAKDEAAKAWLRRPVVGSTLDGKSFQLAGHDALMDCVIRNNSETLNRLLTVDKYDLDFSPSNGSWTLLQTALQHSCLETTSLLLRHGANPNFASKGTPLPLELAKRSGRKQLVALMQKYLERDTAPLAKLLTTREEVEARIESIVKEREAIINADVDFKLDYAGNHTSKRRYHVWLNDLNRRSDCRGVSSDGTEDYSTIVTPTFGWFDDRQDKTKSQFNRRDPKDPVGWGTLGCIVDVRKIGLVNWSIESIDTHEFDEDLLPKDCTETDVETGDYEGIPITIVKLKRKPDGVAESWTEYWLSPAHGNYPIYIASGWKESENSTEEYIVSQRTQWKFIDGIWFPTNVKHRYLCEPRKIDDIGIYELVKARFNVNPFPNVFDPLEDTGEPDTSRKSQVENPIASEPALVLAEQVKVAKGKTGSGSYKINLLVLASDDLKPVSGATVDITLIRTDSGFSGDGGIARFKTDEEGIASIDDSLWPGRYQIQVRAPKGSRFRDTEFAKEETILVVHEDGRYSPREFRLVVKDEK